MKATFTATFEVEFEDNGRDLVVDQAFEAAGDLLPQGMDDIAIVGEPETI